jgi:hypothetical protein
MMELETANHRSPPHGLIQRIQGVPEDEQLTRGHNVLIYLPSPSQEIKQCTS